MSSPPVPTIIEPEGVNQPVTGRGTVRPDSLDGPVGLYKVFRESLLPGWEGGKAQYLPLGVIKRVFSQREVVENVLGELLVGSDADTVNNYTEQICHAANGTSTGGPTFIRTFALLLMLRKGSAIFSFVAHGVSDQCLPLPDRRRGSSDFYLTDESRERLECFASWSLSEKDMFEDWQWKVAAPRFTRDCSGEPPHHEFHPKVCLPLTKDSRTSSSLLAAPSTIGGGYGDVSRVRLLECMYDFEAIFQKAEVCMVQL
jgi:hypothetical protein